MTPLTLYRYRLARTATGTLYVYGYDRATADVRIVELAQFNGDAMTGATKDGRCVVLEGRPARDMHADWLWFDYCRDNSVGASTDATPWQRTFD